MIWVLLVVIVAVVVSAFIFGIRSESRLHEALRSCTDEQLNQLAQGPLDGRQSRWVNAERRRRGIIT